MKIYCAGPMRGYDNYNFPAFDATSNFIRGLGHVAVNPADLDRVHEGWVDYPPDDMVIDIDLKKRCMTRDLLAIMECDAIYLMQGWEKSKGAQAELALAKFLGLSVYYEDQVDEPLPGEDVGPR
jgi:hypothetical protein